MSHVKINPEDLGYNIWKSIFLDTLCAINSRGYFRVDDRVSDTVQTEIWKNVQRIVSVNIGEQPLNAVRRILTLHEFSHQD